MLTIDPRHRPLRGAQAIADYLGQDRQITLRMLKRGTIDADRDGKVWISTPVRVDASFAGRPHAASSEERVAR
jgi:hypothetical protein